MTHETQRAAALQEPDPAAPDAPDASLAPEVRDRLRHLFRHSLQKGRIHPLYLPMLRYRQSRVGT